MTIADYNSRLEQFVEEEQPPAPAPAKPGPAVAAVEPVDQALAYSAH